MSNITIRCNKHTESIQVMTPGGVMAVIHLNLGAATTRRGILDAIQALCAELNFQTNIILDNNERLKQERSH
jgi:hypothetical protein